MIEGAISRIVCVGVIKMRMNRLGTHTASAVQSSPNTTAVPMAYFKTCAMRLPSLAPKFVEMIGWAAWPML